MADLLARIALDWSSGCVLLLAALVMYVEIRNLRRKARR